MIYGQVESAELLVNLCENLSQIYFHKFPAQAQKPPQKAAPNRSTRKTLRFGRKTTKKITAVAFEKITFVEDDMSGNVLRANVKNLIVIKRDDKPAFVLDPARSSYADYQLHRTVHKFAKAVEDEDKHEMDLKEMKTVAKEHMNKTRK